jgi:hypothetical protein
VELNIFGTVLLAVAGILYAGYIRLRNSRERKAIRERVMNSRPVIVIEALLLPFKPMDLLYRTPPVYSFSSLSFPSRPLSPAGIFEGSGESDEDFDLDELDEAEGDLCPDEADSDLDDDLDYEAAFWEAEDRREEECGRMEEEVIAQTSRRDIRKKRRAR